MKDWNYAELSKKAKECGGPEKYVEKIFEGGVVRGRKEMIPVALLSGFGGMIIMAIIGLIAKLRRKSPSAEEVEAAKKELINGIKEYDAANEISESSTAE